MALTPYLACEASAGSGKTWQLSLRYVALLFEGHAPERILCLTFTNKAAKEMSERIAKLLESLERLPNELETLSSWLERSPASLIADLPAVRSRFLRAATRITTIDAFLHQILRSFSLHLGLSPLFEVGAQGEGAFFAHFYDRLLDEKGRDDLVALALEQHRSVESILEELQTLYKSESDLLAFAPPPPDPEAIAQAEAGVHEAAAAVQALILNHPEASNRAKTQFDNGDPKVLAQKSWLNRETLNYTTFKKCYSPELDRRFEEFKAALKRWFDAREQAALWRLSRLQRAYSEAAIQSSQQARRLSFDDVTHLVYELLSKNRSAIDGAFFYFRLDGAIEHLLIDEFQDTSTVQFEILRPIIEEFTAGGGTGAQLKSFFYVGDVKQSIYRFRGGNPHLFSAVQQLYGQIKSQSLTHNYRSRPELVCFVNDHFAPLIRSFLPQKPHRKAGGFVQVRHGEEPIEGVIAHVDALLKAKIAPERIAVLAFSNKDGQAVAEALSDAFLDLKVATETTQLLIHQPPIEALIEACKWLYFDDKLALANFNRLRGADPFETLDRTPFEPLLHGVPLDLCHGLIEQFQLGSDGDLLRFLEWVGTLPSIEALLFNYSQLDATASSSIGQGLSVLTIHKSKGLEFDHLIVLDRLSSKRGESSRLILNHEGVALKSIHYRLGGREHVDPAYHQILSAQREEADRDTLNVLYVALTRARESLFIAAKPKSSAFSPLKLPEAVAIGTFPAQSGEQTPVPESAPEPITPRPLGRQESARTDTEEESSNLPAKLFGLALHHTLEVMGRFDRPCADLALDSMRNHYGRLVAPEQIAGRIEALLEDGRLEQLLANRRAYREVPLVVSGEVMRLDLLLHDGHSWVVVDYKSGRHNPAHTAQVARYIQGLQQAGLWPARGIILYLGEKIELKEVTV